MHESPQALPVVQVRQQPELPVDSPQAGTLAVSSNGSSNTAAFGGGTRNIRFMLRLRCARRKWIDGPRRRAAAVAAGEAYANAVSCWNES
jgi:hypothetical protein